MAKNINIGTKPTLANSDELGKLDEVKGTEAPQNTVNESDDMTKKSEEPQEKAKETKEETKSIIHVVEYVGTGIWVDSKRVSWSSVEHRGTDIIKQRNITDEEFQTREDIKFMIGYGAMRETIVQM